MKAREVGGAIKGNKCVAFIYLGEEEGCFIDIPRTMMREIVNAAKEINEARRELGEEELEVAAYVKDGELVIGDELDAEELAEATGGTTPGDLGGGGGPEEEEEDGEEGEEEIVDEEEEEEEDGGEEEEEDGK